MTVSEFAHEITGGRPWGEVAYWTSQICLLIVALAAAWFARKQITAFATIELLKYIQAEQLREDREYVLLKLDADHTTWSSEERRIANRVCISYDVMGRLLQTGLASRKFFMRPAAPSVYRTYQKLEPYIDAISEEHGYSYCAHYRWFAGQALRWYRPKSN